VIASAQQSHDKVACTSCHTGMNIPPVPTTCFRCHGAGTFGTANCLACHAGAVHDPTPSVGTCTGCHPDARRHADGFSCTTCHKNTVKMHHSVVAPADMAALGRTQTGGSLGLPSTGYPPGGGTPYVQVFGGLAAGFALLLLAWRLLVISRRQGGGEDSVR
jgi:hypothetical protein